MKDEILELEPIEEELELEPLELEEIEDNQPKDTSPKMSKKESALLGAAQGLTFDFGDEIVGGLKSLFTDKTYEEERDSIRDYMKQAEEQNPGSYLSGDIAGGLLPALATGGASLAGSLGKTAIKQGMKQAAKQGVKQVAKKGAKDLVKASAKGSATGAGYGALVGAGKAEDIESVPEMALDTAISGAVVGGLVPSAVEGVKKVARPIGKGLKTASKGVLKRAADLDDKALDLVLKDPKGIREASGDLFKSVDEVAQEGGKRFKEAISLSKEGKGLLSDTKNIKGNSIIKSLDDLLTSSSIDESGASMVNRVKDSIYGKVDPSISKLKRQLVTKSLSPAEKRQINRLIEYRKSNIKELDLSQKDLKEVLEDVYDVAYSSGGAARDKLKQVGGVISSTLKDANPEYRQKMAEASRRFKFIESLEDMYGVKKPGSVFNSDELAEAAERTVDSLEFPLRKKDTAAGNLRKLIKEGKVSDEDFLQKQVDEGMLDPKVLDNVRSEALAEELSKSKKFSLGDFVAPRAIAGGALGLSGGGPLGGVAGLLGAAASKPISAKILTNADKVSPILKRSSELMSRSTDAAGVAYGQQAIKSSAEESKNNLKLLNKASVEDLSDLANKMGSVSGAEGFSNTLRAIAQEESERARKAKIYSLMQQPAFRKLLEKIRDEEE